MSARALELERELEAEREESQPERRGSKDNRIALNRSGSFASNASAGSAASMDKDDSARQQRPMMSSSSAISTVDSIASESPSISAIEEEVSVAMPKSHISSAVRASEGPVWARTPAGSSAATAAVGVTNDTSRKLEPAVQARPNLPGLGALGTISVGTSGMSGDTPHRGHYRSSESPSSSRGSRSRGSRSLPTRGSSRFQVNLDYQECSASESVHNPTVLKIVYDSPRKLAQMLVTSMIFECFSAVLIIASGTFVGVETDFMAKHGGQTQKMHGHVHMFFNIVFLMECALRVGAEGADEYFTKSKERRWNWAETLLAGSSAIDLFLALLRSDLTEAGLVLRAVRLFRLVRMLRLIRAMKFAREFQRMVYAVISCVRTLMCSMVMLFFIMYIFALVFCQGATEFLLMDGISWGTPQDMGALFDPAAFNSNTPEQMLYEMYGTLPKSFYSLFAAISQGISWHYAFQPLSHINWMYAGGFLLYITLVLFGVMNVVTSVFVESAILSAQRYRDLIVQQKEHEREIAMEHMKEVFSQIDYDGSGEICIEEMEYFLTEPALRSYVEALGISAENTRLLFRLMDVDGSGKIDMGEFCEGCLRLQGDAKSVDVHTMIYQVRQFLTKWSEFTGYVEERLGTYDDGSICMSRHSRSSMGSSSSHLRNYRHRGSAASAGPGRRQSDLESIQDDKEFVEGENSNTRRTFSADFFSSDGRSSTNSSAYHRFGVADVGSAGSIERTGSRLSAVPPAGRPSISRP